MGIHFGLYGYPSSSWGDFHSSILMKLGSIGLDIALGVGGYPKGRVVEIYGPESRKSSSFSFQLN